VKGKLSSLLPFEGREKAAFTKYNRKNNPLSFHGKEERKSKPQNSSGETIRKKGKICEGGRYFMKGEEDRG